MPTKTERGHEPTLQKTIIKIVLTCFLKLSFLSLLLDTVGLLHGHFVHASEQFTERKIKTLDDQLSEIEDYLPGFGGWFFDGNKTLNIFLQDPSKTDGLELRLLSYAHSLTNDDETYPLFQSLTYNGIKIIKGKYSFIQLKRWYEKIQSVLDIQGVVYIDIDEARNRIAVGMHEKRLETSIHDILKRNHIPRSAVIIEESELIHRTTSLKDEVRPVLGGVQISSDGYCTLGLNVYRNNVFGFLTASHCTYNQGGVENTPFFQPESGSTNRLIGYETVDPTEVDPIVKTT